MLARLANRWRSTIGQLHGVVFGLSVMHVVYYLGIKPENIQFTTIIFQITVASWNWNWDFLKKLGFPCCAAFSWRFLHFPSLPHFCSVFVWFINDVYHNPPREFVIFHSPLPANFDFGSCVFNASSLCWACNIFTFRDGLINASLSPQSLSNLSKLNG